MIGTKKLNLDKVTDEYRAKASKDIALLNKRWKEDPEMRRGLEEVMIESGQIQ